MPKGHPYHGAPCPHFPERYKTEASHIAHKKTRWRYDEKKREDRIPKQFASDAYSVPERLKRLLTAIRHRCENPKSTRFHRYGGRGITCDLTYEDLLRAWIFDEAAKMRRPSIDRMNNDGNYTFTNIRFIEQADNVRRGVEVREKERFEKRHRKPLAPTTEVAP
jgi:hypothetical protein